MAFIVGDKGHVKTTESLDDLETVAKQFRDREIDILALSGGDGTYHNTITKFIHVYGDQPLPKFAFLRGGTLNAIASSCGVKGHPEKLLMDLIYHFHEGSRFETKQLQPMRINDHYGFIWGCGVIFHFMEAYYGDGTPSAFHAAWTLTRTITSALLNGRFARDMFRRFDGEITVEGRTWPYRNYSAIYAGAIRQLGLDFDVFYYTKQGYPFHGVGFSLPPRNVLRYVPKMFLGRPNGCPDLLEAGAHEMTVRLKEAQGYTIDGDMYPPVDYFHIRPGPILNVVIPQV